MPYLPTEPLVPYLRGAIDQDLLGQGGFRSGIEAVAIELSRITGQLPRSAERTIVRILRGEVKVIKERTADEIAAALGMHGRDIWDDWFELTEGKASGWSVRSVLRRVLGREPLPDRVRSS